MQGIIDRHAVRAILLTPAQKVLLLRVEVENGRFWITPGGGAQTGETAAQTLRRELAEELGLDDPAIGPLVWRRQHLLTLYNRRWRQSEDYYIVPTAPFTPIIRDPAEARLQQEARWWTLPEIRHTAERLVPQSLLRIVRDYCDHGPPTSPPIVEIVEDWHAKI